MMKQKMEKYRPKPKTEFEKGLFKRFEKIGALEELNRAHLEWREKEKTQE